MHRDEQHTVSLADALVAEIKAVLDSVPASRRTEILRGITDFFLQGATLYSKDQMAMFDEVFVTVTEHADRDALVELSKRLMSCARAPSTLIRKLASHPDLKISGVLLKEGSALTDEELAAIVATASPSHLMIIASRDNIGETVTDALISRGNSDIMRVFVANPKARVSHVGFVKLINAAKRDGSLTEIVAARADLPDELKPFIGMLRRASGPAQAGTPSAAAAG
jgi:uncharacterized protein (DUF2336 family)